MSCAIASVRRGLNCMHFVVSNKTCVVKETCPSRRGNVSYMAIYATRGDMTLAGGGINLLGFFGEWCRAPPIRMNRVLLRLEPRL